MEYGTHLSTKFAAQTIARYNWKPSCLSFITFYTDLTLVWGKRLTSNASNWVMSTEVWQIQAKGGSRVELLREVGLILDVTCLFHP